MHTFNSPFSRTTWVNRYQKGKTNLDFTEARNSGLGWAVCKSAPHFRQSQHPTTQFFTGRMPFLPPNQQRQSTEGKLHHNNCKMSEWAFIQNLASSSTYYLALSWVLLMSLLTVSFWGVPSYFLLQLILTLESWHGSCTALKGNLFLCKGCFILALSSF